MLRIRSIESKPKWVQDPKSGEWFAAGATSPKSPMKQASLATFMEAKPCPEVQTRVATGELDKKIALTHKWALNGGAAFGFFQELDADGDGFLDINELRPLVAWLEQMGDSKHQATDLLASLDTDGDGKVSFEEFEAYYNTLGSTDVFHPSIAQGGDLPDEVEAEPEEIEAEPEEIGAEPEEIEAEPEEIGAEPEEIEAEPEEIEAEPEEIGAEPEEIEAEPEEIGAEPEEIGAEPEEIGAEPEEIEAEPEEVQVEMPSVEATEAEP